MKKYKFSVSKGQNKYTIVVSGETPEEAKEKVHKEGYSILSVEEMLDTELIGNKFYFQVLDEKTKEIKSGIIIGEDIFKIYLKLRKSLGYQVISLFAEIDRDSPQEKKDETMKNLKDQFDLFDAGGEKQVIEEKIDVKNSSTNLDSFHLKKELDDTYKFIDFILKKLQNLIEDTGNFNLTIETKEKLKEIYNGIVKIKKTTNISKLKQVGELALLKIGEIELKNVEESQQQTSKDLLKETNTLLKQIGSKEVFIEEGKDIKKMVNNYLTTWSESFSKVKNIKSIISSKKTEIDTTSYSYLKTVLLLEKYKQRKKQNTKEILSNLSIFLFPFGKNLEKKEYILLKRRVIQQNISLLEAKKIGRMFSYTFIKKGYNNFTGYILTLFNTLKKYILGVLYIYLFIFLGCVSINYYGFSQIPQFNFIGIWYVICLLLFTICVSLSRSIFSLTLNFVFLSFFFIFGVVNL